MRIPKGSYDNEARPEWRGCGFHEFLELDGYDGGEFPPEVRA
jgi:hypothetical protein